MLKSKEKNKRRRLFHFMDLVKTFIFCDERYITYKGFKGYAYEIENKDEQKARELSKKYDNMEVIKTFCQYAPEIKKTWVFIANTEVKTC